MRSQLDSWACQARPLRLFRATELLVLEASVEVFSGFEHLVDDASDLERNESASDSLGLSSELCFVEGFDLRVVLYGSDTGMTEGELEVTVSGFGS